LETAHIANDNTARENKVRTREMGVVVIAVVRKVERYNEVKIELNDS